MKKIPSSQRITISARLPKPIVRGVRAIAVKQKRSLSGLIEFVFEQLVKEERNKPE